MNASRARTTVPPKPLRRPESLYDPTAPPTGFAAKDPCILFAYSVLARETRALVAHRPRGRRAPTPENIHQLRVAARRLRVALRLFGRMLPKRAVTVLPLELKWFAGSLGELRDLDVYAESFQRYLSGLPSAERGGFRGYELYRRRERNEARRRAHAALTSLRTAALFETFDQLIAAGPTERALRRWRSLTVREHAQRSIRRSVGRVLRVGAPLVARSRPPKLHELRIKTKRLRYELEFFANVFPKLARHAQACKALQDLLGAHQDVYAGNARLRRYAVLLRERGIDDSLPPALEQLRRGQFAVARGVRATFRDLWPDFAAAIDTAPRAIG